jgi:ABC-2 type transport system ATP-binding protein
MTVSLLVMNAIVVRDLSKQFGRLKALDGISFEVARGETFGFLGPNGAGKTTTIRILTGISRPTSGHATIFGFDIERERLLARRYLGIVSETSNVYDELSAWDNMMFTAELYYVPRAAREAKAKELLDLFGLLERRNDLAHGFSKGMKRRLTLAMGLINDPDLVFLDEPTSGLDVASNLIIRDVIRELNKSGVTIFLTTHNIEEANLTCDRVAIINKGKIAAVDSPEKLKGTIQSVQSVEVSFNRPAPDALGVLSGIPGVNEGKKEGDKIKLYTANPAEIIPLIVSFAEREHIGIVSLNTVGPSLEDVFIRLTGLEGRSGLKGVHAID